MNQRIVLAGGSGFLGRALAEHFVAQGDEVFVLTRGGSRVVRPGLEMRHWNGRDGGDWESLLEGATAVINLTGRSVNCRHTPSNRQEIMDSRIDSVRAIDRALRKVSQPPSVWIQAGSLAIYGDAHDHVCTEDAPSGNGFPVEVCQRWEEAFKAAANDRIRKVILRIGFVLGGNGGALTTLETITRLGLGGTVGSGRQWISWIHLADFVRLIEWAIARPDLGGIYNATGPNPVTNAEFMRLLRRTLRRPWSPPVPAWAARLGAWAMRTEGDLALTGRRCVPARLAELGFWFACPALGPALQEIYHPET